MEALELANRIRTRRAALKRDLKERKETVPELLEHPPDFIETMKIEDLVLATPKYGKVKTKNTLRQTKISPSKTVGGMSERQRTELCWQMNGDHH